MRLHGNAKTCPHSRLLIVTRVQEEGWSVAAAAQAAGVSERTAAKWLARYRSEGGAGLRDRSSAPHRIPRRTPASRERAIVALRRLRMTAAEIAECLGLARSTVCALLRRLGLGRLAFLEPSEPANRYERRLAGEVLHLDTKKLGRIERIGHRISGQRRGPARRAGGRRSVGWEYVHVAVDDATRLASALVLPDEKATSAVAFLAHAVSELRARGVTVERVMTDNGSAYCSHAFAQACRELGIRHLRTRAYRPRTNGKAERFIQTLTRRWAYGQPYASSEWRRAALSTWLEDYNQRRPHGSLGNQTPAARLAALMNNAAGNHN
jgi:transposase InsO family protein